MPSRRTDWIHYVVVWTDLHDALRWCGHIHRAEGSAQACILRLTGIGVLTKDGFRVADAPAGR